MARQTKEELMEIIEQKNEEIAGLNEEIKRLDRYKQYDDMADEFKALYDSFVRSGFTDDQAFVLLGQAMTVAGNMAAKPRFPF